MNSAMNKEDSAIRIRDVARRAGVSPATVSRVLNASPTVQPDYQTRVLKAIAELGYRPNRLARNLRRRKAEMVGVVVADIENPFFTEVVRALEDAAYQLGYRVLLCNTDENEEKQRAYLEVLAAERVLGVILSPSNPRGREIGELLDLGIPLIAFDRLVYDPRADTVIADNVTAGRAATRHLLAAGHTRIAFIGSPDIETVVQRVKGYEEVMRSRGLEPRMVPGWSRIGGGTAAAEELLRQREAPTALIAGNNLMALGALRALHMHGVRVPQEVAFVGIDDPFWSEVVEPPLTTLAQPVRRMAECIIELLVERLSLGRQEPRHRVFDFELRVRASCGTKHDHGGRLHPTAPRDGAG